ncbi:hypothetical protein BN1723_015274, partial [Verticillium longisporum]
YRGTLWHFEVFITCTRADTDARWYPGGLQIHFTAQRHSPRPGEAAQVEEPSCRGSSGAQERDKARGTYRAASAI